jgi:hypothetical protein
MKNWQLPTLFVFGVVFLAVLLWLVFLHPTLTYDECIVVKVVLSLAAAGIGAIVPGTISARAGGFAKAGGAAAFFLIVFFKYDCPKNEPHPREVAAPAPAPVVTQPAPTFHDADQNGNRYVISWDTDPNCSGFDHAATHRCNFTHTQTSFAGDNTPYDHWELKLQTPGPVTSVLCQPTGSNEFNQVKGDPNGEIDGHWATCKGWINGGDAPIHMTVYYQQKW